MIYQARFSDGGLITTLIEMSISSNIGFEVNYNDKKHDFSFLMKIREL